MLLTIGYCPEMNVYTVHNGNGLKRIVVPDDFAAGGPLEKLAPVFHAAKDAVDSGKAVEGVCIEV